jgi:Spy/CpxP family protein refolding chaperone
MLKKLLLIAVLAVATVSAFGQGFRGGGMAGMMNSPSGLLRRDDVKTELQLSDDQKNKIAEISDATRSKMRELFQGGGDPATMQKAMAPIMADANDQILKVLNDDQKKRLKEIGYQIAGYGVLATDKELQTTLALTDDQKTKITDLSKTAQEANASVFQKAQNGEIERSEVGAAMTKNREALNSAIEALLTADQKAKFKTLQGKTFVQTSPAFGGPPRGGN